MGATLSILYDTLFVVARTAHIVAAAMWIGGSLFYAFVLGPLIARPENQGIRKSVAESFGRAVTLSVWTLLFSGAYMTFARLTNTHVGVPYAVVLGLKILLALWMFLLVGAIGRNRGKRQRTAIEGGPGARLRGLIPLPTLVLALGLVVFVLSAILTSIYQSS